MNPKNKINLQIAELEMFEIFQRKIEKLGCNIINKIPSYKFYDYKKSLCFIALNKIVVNKFVNNLKSFFNKKRFEFLLNYQQLNLVDLYNCIQCLKNEYPVFNRFWHHTFFHQIFLPLIINFFRNNYTIKTLNLSYNKLYQLPPDIQLIKDLEFLYAEGNLLKNLPSWLGCLQNMKFFSFSMNEFVRSDSDRIYFINLWKSQNKQLLVHYYIYDSKNREWVLDLKLK